ncbi:hypothetical protein P7K49_038436, partial [Saguinus oedipus]
AARSLREGPQELKGSAEFGGPVRRPGSQLGGGGGSGCGGRGVQMTQGQVFAVGLHNANRWYILEDAYGTT